jgi:hypothetical protein
MKDLIVSFIDFKDCQRTTNRGGVVMYDVFGYYKYLTEQELWRYFIANLIPKSTSGSK